LNKRTGEEAVCRFCIYLLVLTLGFISAAQNSGAQLDQKEAEYIDNSIRGTPSYQPRNGFIPDANTALKIAEAVLIPIYGKEQIAAEQPFRAILRGNTWMVVGTLKPGLAGGTAIIRLSKSDGRVLFVSHSQ
jgi:NTF2 fold immunity protein